MIGQVLGIKLLLVHFTHVAPVKGAVLSALLHDAELVGLSIKAF